MLNMRRGCVISSAKELEEGFKLTKEGIEANVNTEKILELLGSFVMHNHNKKMCFFMETAALVSKERDDGTCKVSENERMHFKIEFYDVVRAIAIINTIGEIILSDGLCVFGFGTEDGDEMRVDKYNVVKVRCGDKDKYRSVFENKDVRCNEALKSAWDTFDAKNPGYSVRTSVRGVTSIDAPAILTALHI